MKANNTYIRICQLHWDSLLRNETLSTPELLVCPDCETPFKVGIRKWRERENQALEDVVKKLGER